MAEEVARVKEHRKLFEEILPPQTMIPSLKDDPKLQKIIKTYGT
jgi:hypothetical protein